MVAYATPVAARLAGRPLRQHNAIVLAGIALHVAGLLALWITKGAFLVSSLTEGLAAVALLVACGTLPLLRQPRMAVVTDSLLACATLLLLAASGAHGVKSSAVEMPVWFLVLHVTLIFVGLAGFAISFCLSLLFLVLRGRLKRKELAGLQELPALDTIDALNFRAMVTGFVTISAGALIGGVWAWFHGLESDLTIWATVLVWLWYAVGLQGRVIGGWRGRFAALFSVVGFAGVTLLVAMLGALFGSWHGMGA
jgi:ABC-type uncharacterized transport system permease subunit